MERIARELNVKLTWDVNEAASEDELRTCEAAFTRIDVPFGPSHRTFLRRYNGARYTYNKVDATHPDTPYGATFTILSCAQIVAAVEEIYLTEEPFAFLPKIFWDPTIPIVDIDDGHHLASDPRLITYGEPALVWGHSELGATYGDGISYVAHSFESFLIQMFDRIGLKRGTPELWEDVYERLRFDWSPPDNRHRTNFPLDRRSTAPPEPIV